MSAEEQSFIALGPASYGGLAWPYFELDFLTEQEERAWGITQEIQSPRPFRPVSGDVAASSSAEGFLESAPYFGEWVSAVAPSSIGRSNI